MDELLAVSNNFEFLSSEIGYNDGYAVVNIASVLPLVLLDFLGLPILSFIMSSGVTSRLVWALIRFGSMILYLS